MNFNETLAGIKFHGPSPLEGGRGEVNTSAVFIELVGQ